MNSTILTRMHAVGRQLPLQRARRRACLTGLCALGWATAPGPASGASADDPVAIDWRAPAGCPAAPALRSQVEEYLGQSLDAPRSQPVSVKVAITRTGAGWRMLLEIRTADGASSEPVGGRDCATLADIAALKIAMAVDPQSVIQRLAEPRPAPPPQPEPDPVSPPDRTPTVRLGLRTLSGVAWGAMPDPGATFAWAGSVLGDGWRVDVGGQFWVPQDVVLDEDGSGGRIRALGGFADGCWVPEAKRVTFPLCGGLEFASMRGEGVGVAPAGSARRLWGAGRVSGALIWSPHPVIGLVLQPGAAFAFFRPEFALADGRTVHRANFFDLRLTAGLEVRFGLAPSGQNARSAAPPKKDRAAEQISEQPS